MLLSFNQASAFLKLLLHFFPMFFLRSATSLLTCTHVHLSLPHRYLPLIFKFKTSLGLYLHSFLKHAHTFLFSHSQIFIIFHCICNQDSSVGITTNCGLDNQGIVVWFLVGTRNNSLLCSIETSSGAQPAFKLVGTESCSPRNKVTGVWSCALPFSADVRNAWNLPPLPHLSSWPSA
jgi:hypothetical protein